MGLAGFGLLDDSGQFLTPSVVDRLGVVLFGLGLRLLADPAEPFLDQLADMLGMVADTKVAADHLGDPRGGPQEVGTAVGFGPFEQESFEFLDLLGAEPDLGSKVGFGGKSVGRRLGHLFPAVERSPAHTEDAGDGGRRLALFDHRDGASASSFEFGNGSNGSHTDPTMPTDQRFL